MNVTKHKKMANDNSKPQTQVSDEEFNQFHTIDRELYACLVQNLGRDTAESVHVMAFWMWLEKETNDMKLIERVLSLPPHLLNQLADETRVCLRFLESDKFQFGGQIKLLPEILNRPVDSLLRFFHENRNEVLQGVAKINNTVCTRAFRDIRRWIEIGESSRGAAMVNREENVVGRNLAATVDDRTIFLTFPRRCPIAEDEVKEYFTRRFGDFIEALIYQEVKDEERVLHARMVVKPAAVAVMEVIAAGRGKAMYTINGKPVFCLKNRPL